MDTKSLFEIAKKQGLSFLLLAIAVWYFWNENEKLNARITALSDDNKAITAAYQVDHAQMRTVIEGNTRVVEKNTAVFESILKKKSSE